MEEPNEWKIIDNEEIFNRVDFVKDHEKFKHERDNSHRLNSSL